jgi:hypothetical protein
MNKTELEKEMQMYVERLSFFKNDILRLEGIIFYLENKIKELQNSNLTNS